MDVYGFPPNNIFFLLAVDCLNPGTNSADFSSFSVDVTKSTNNFFVYDPTQTVFDTTTGTVFGTSNLPQLCSMTKLNTDFPDWISTINDNLDLRAFYRTCNGNAYGPTAFDFPADEHVLNTTSSYTGNPVRFTTEAIFYAQSAYFITIVMVQWSNVFACKSRKMSLTYSAFNKHMFGGIILETCIFIILCYIPGINGVFGGRQVPFFLMGIPGLAFSMMLLLW